MMDFQPIIDFIRSLYPDREFIPLHEPVFAGNEKKYLLDCIDSTFVSSVGKYVDRFEEMICQFTGAKYAVAAVNGTAALHIALKLAGVKSGDLVITQPLTFIATCNAISYCGAEPVFIDIDRKTLGLSADALEDWLNQNVVLSELDGILQCFYNPQMNTNDSSQMSSNYPGNINTLIQSDLNTNRVSSLVPICDTQFVKIRGLRRIAACLPMHTFGHPCEIDRIMEICNRYHILVVEDAAESIGSYYKGQHTGTFGKLGILSFNGNKTITTGGGGMIITNDEKLGKLAKHLTTQAKVPHPWKFEHDMIGYNYRLPNINAALGCAQMESLEKLITIKRDIAVKYQEFFANSSLEFITEPVNSRSNYWLNAVLCENEAERDEFLQFCNAGKVLTRPAWTLMNKLPMFKDAVHSSLGVALDIEARLVNLPSGVLL